MSNEEKKMNNYEKTTSLKMLKINNIRNNRISEISA